jgi:hypothetical protein
MSPADARYVACRSCGRTSLAQRMTCPYCGSSLRVQGRPPAPPRTISRAAAPSPPPAADTSAPGQTSGGPRYDLPAPLSATPHEEPAPSASLGPLQDISGARESPYFTDGSGVPPPQSDLPAHRTGRRRVLAGVLGAIAAIAVAVVIVLAIVVFPHVASGNSVTYGTPIPFSEAIGPGRSAQGSALGAPWTVVAVVGIGSGESTGVQSAVGSQVPNCTTLWANASAEVAPATPSNASAGDVSLWVIASENLSGDVLITLVTASPSEITTYNGIIVTGRCTSTFDGGGAIPSSVVDTPAVVASANIAGGSKFLADYPVATVDLTLLSPYWVVEYSTCPAYATTGTGTEWVDIEYASNGTEVVKPGSGLESC